MGKKWDPDTTSLEKMLAVYTLLLFERRRFTLTTLSKELNIPKPTLLRYLTRLQASRFGNILSEKIGRESYYWIDYSAKPPQLSLNVESLQQLALCRDFMTHLLPHAMRLNVDAILQQTTAFLPKDTVSGTKEQGNDILKSTAGKGLLSIGESFSKGRIDYAPFKGSMEKIIQAIREHIVCEISYKSSRQGAERTFDYAPKRLIAFREALHVSGWKVTDKGAVDALYDLPADLALHRITKVSLTKRFSEKIPDIIEKHDGSFGYIEAAPFTVTVRFTPSVATYVAERQWSTDQQIQDHEDGAITLTLTARSPDEVCSWVLGFGTQAELLTPQGLRNEIAKRVDYLHDVYSNKDA